VAVAFVAAAVLVMWIVGPERPPEVAPTPPSPRVEFGEAAEPSGEERKSADRTLQGLKGTTPSGGLDVDEAGHFVPNRNALLFFQYFLSASNEATPDELAEHMRQAIAARLAPPADAEAADFLARYMAYLAAGDAEFREPGMTDAVALERRIQWVRELRREYFGAELAERLFGEEEDARRIHRERQRISRDPTRDPDEARRRILELEEEYPEAVREARARASLPLRHANEERSLREAGASEAEVDALRERNLGREAADRMRALDAARADWAARLATYRAEREARLSGLDDPAEREAVVVALRAEHFSEEERHRVEILDQQEEVPR